MFAMRRECCSYCLWLTPVRKDGTVWKHRPPTAEDKYGRKIPNRYGDHCEGSNKPYARFGNENEEK